MAEKPSIEYNALSSGMNLDQSLSQLKKGCTSYCLNGTVENIDGQGINYQNELGNTLTLRFPEGFVLIGKHFIPEKQKHVFFLVNPAEHLSEIGYMENNDGVYRTIVSHPDLNFSLDHPIHKAVHRITNCSTEIYWTDGYNSRRWLDIDNVPSKLAPGSSLCDPLFTQEADVSRMKLQQNFSIPSIGIKQVTSGGSLLSGVYQFAIQYCDEGANPFTGYYSVTNPLPIADTHLTTQEFSYPVGKSITLEIKGLDTAGHFKWFNLAVIKTVNGISTPELAGTYSIEGPVRQLTYSGAKGTPLSMGEIFEKFPFYDIAQDLTTVQDVLVWDGLTSVERINYQEIASKIILQWESWRIPAGENYSDEKNAADLRGYLRDEVYAFEIVFLLTNGKQTDSFHIPGRELSQDEKTLPDVPDTNPDFTGTPSYYVDKTGYSPYWKIYNTASVTGFNPSYTEDISYKGPCQYGEFAYWESTDTYPCNKEVWGDLSGKPIRHHKFPDCLVSPIHENSSSQMGERAIFPIGVKIDTAQVAQLIERSSLTREQKDAIAGFKIVRGDRASNKSIVAKGILRNVGSYQRDDQTYYYPNYPYNDLREDPFLNSSNNAYSQLCQVWEINIENLTPDENGTLSAAVRYTDCNNNKSSLHTVYTEGSFELCSLTKPVVLSPSKGTSGSASYENWYVSTASPLNNITVGWTDPVEGYREVSQETMHIKVVSGTGGPKIISGVGIPILESIHTPSLTCSVPSSLSPVTDKTRQVFNSPDTSFGQPFLGNTLKLETALYGKGSAHFTEVKKHAKYKFITEEMQKKALDSSNALGDITDLFDTSAMFAAYQAYLKIYEDGITRKNFAYSFNSIADYNCFSPVPNQGKKQRSLETARYLSPGVQSIDITLNNYQRESSVYLKSGREIPFPEEFTGIKEQSRFTISEAQLCSSPSKEKSIEVTSYYGSLKNEAPSQWGQIYSYETVDTGYQRMLNEGSSTVFGGDTFIGRFAFKTKLPFFLDNRVNAPDDSDIFYDEIGNVAYPKYWHSSRSILKDYMSSGGLLSNIISYKAHSFDCPGGNISSLVTTTTTLAPGSTIQGDEKYTYEGYFYLFAYGVPSFYCESSYNLDLRQAFNDREGEFWPHVSSSIPDEWLQESRVPIAQDNTYYYNSSFSKQNRENYFSHLPLSWESLCYTKYPFRAIYSDQRGDSSSEVNNWLIYRPVSYFDFPQNYGALTSLDGIQNRAILARFENKSLLYNTMLTLDTSNPQNAFLGNSSLFKGAPPVDFAETDQGYMGSQHKMLLKIPQGQISVDTKRGQVFLLSGNSAQDISGFGSGMNRWLTEHLSFEIKDHFPQIEVDNHYKGIGLHGVYDSKYDRILLTKLDYSPLSKDITFENNKFFIRENGIKKEIFLSDLRYFCNRSFTLSYNLNTRSWIAFHSYLPNFYIGENNFFYSGTSFNEDFEAEVIVPFTPTTTTTTTAACSLSVAVLDEFPLTTTTTVIT